MDTVAKLERLGEGARYDLCGACLNPRSDPAAHRRKGKMDRWIYPAALPDGRSIRLLKVLMFNQCENDCLYCAHRSGIDRQPLSFRPDELSTLFVRMLGQNLVQGLFLSSAVYRDTVWCMDEMLETLEILRYRHRFPGYVHLKVLPGALFSQVQRAVYLASRVSVNLEAPTPESLAKIAPKKEFRTELFQRVRMLSALIRKANHGKRYGPKGQTTQFMVGAAAEPDTELLTLTKNLYDNENLSRVYFSAFQPVPETPFENRPPTPLLREHRLYQADFLFRKYGFSPGELGFGKDGNLPLGKDPKTVWAEGHPEFFPVEVNTAPRHELLRIPGFGPKTVQRLLKIRPQHCIHSLEQLKKMGAMTKRALGYILLDGFYPGKPSSSQLPLWRPERVVFGVHRHEEV